MVQNHWRGESAQNHILKREAFIMKCNLVNLFVIPFLFEW